MYRVVNWVGKIETKICKTCTKQKLLSYYYLATGKLGTYLGR